MHNIEPIVHNSLYARRCTSGVLDKKIMPVPTAMPVGSRSKWSVRASVLYLRGFPVIYT